MLAFIDESGYPHPNDPSTRPVVVAVCVEAEDLRLVSGRLHALKRDLLKREKMELKGVNLLNRRTFRRKPDYVNFLEEFFGNLLNNLPITVFGVIMQAPFEDPVEDDGFLPNRFRYCWFRGFSFLRKRKTKWPSSCLIGSAKFIRRHRLAVQQLSVQVGGRQGVRPYYGRAFFRRFADIGGNTDSRYGGVGLYDSIRKRSCSEPHHPRATRIYTRFAVGTGFIEQSTRDLVSHDGFDRPGLYRLGAGDL